MKTAILLLALCQLRTPPDAPGWEPPPLPKVERQVVYTSAKPRVVVVSMRGCAPCVRVKLRLASLKRRKDIDYFIEDINDWNARVAPGLRVTSAPTIFVWRDPSKANGGRFGSGVTIEDIDKHLGKSSAFPFLSINGSSPNAQHNVTINGSWATVHPNTETAWRRHVGEDHGIRGAYTMTPSQLAIAHARAH